MNHDNITNQSIASRFDIKVWDSMRNNREYIASFIAWRCFGNKFKLVTDDLHLTSARRKYQPVEEVLEAIVHLFQIGGINGLLAFKFSRKFTRDDHLVTTILELSNIIRRKSNKSLSSATIKRALKILHDAGFIYKTHGYYGTPPRGRLFIDLKGYKLFTTLKEKLPFGANECKKMTFPLAGPADFGYNQAWEGLTIDPSAHTPPNDIPPGCPFNNLIDGKVTFQITPYVEVLIRFIESHDTFIDLPDGLPTRKSSFTAQEIAALIHAVEKKNLTLNFLKRYTEAIRLQRYDDWCLRLSMGAFCNAFDLIKRRINWFEAECELLSEQPNGVEHPLMFVEEADSFLRRISFRLATHQQWNEKHGLPGNHMCMEDELGAQNLFIAASSSEFTNEQRKEIYDTYRYDASQWFRNNPAVYFALQALGYEFQKILNWTDDELPTHILQERYIRHTGYVAHQRKIIAAGAAFPRRKKT